MNKTTGISMSDLPPGLSNPARRALAAAGITTLAECARISEAELLKLHGLGPKGVRLIGEALAKRGLKFAILGESRSVSERANPQIGRRAPKKNG